MGVNKLFPNLR